MGPAAGWKQGSHSTAHKAANPSPVKPRDKAAARERPPWAVPGHPTQRTEGPPEPPDVGRTWQPLTTNTGRSRHSRQTWPVTRRQKQEELLSPSAQGLNRGSPPPRGSGVCGGAGRLPAKVSSGRRKYGWNRGRRRCPSSDLTNKEAKCISTQPGSHTLPRARAGRLVLTGTGRTVSGRWEARAHEGSHPARTDPSPGDAPAKGKGHVEGAAGQGLSSSSSRDGSGNKRSDRREASSVFVPCVCTDELISSTRFWSLLFSYRIYLF